VLIETTEPNSVFSSGHEVNPDLDPGDPEGTRLLQGERPGRGRPDHEAGGVRPVRGLGAERSLDPGIVQQVVDADAAGGTCTVWGHLVRVG
jgi:hypothetical protein